MTQNRKRVQIAAFRSHRSLTVRKVVGARRLRLRGWVRAGRANAYSNLTESLRVEITQLARKVRSNARSRNTQQTKTGGCNIMSICSGIFSLLAAAFLTGSAEYVITLTGRSNSNYGLLALTRARALRAPRRP